MKIGALIRGLGEAWNRLARSDATFTRSINFDQARQATDKIRCEASLRTFRGR